MANENVPDSNHSQFFVTLDKCEHLNGKHTIFGKVAGATLFNALRIGEVETAGDTPTQPIKITAASVVKNPFPELVARSYTSKTSSSEKDGSGSRRKKKRKKIKNTNLLSFSDPLEEDQTGAARKRPRKVKASKQKNIAKPSRQTEKSDETRKEKSDPDTRNSTLTPGSSVTESDTAGIEDVVGTEASAMLGGGSASPLITVEPHGVSLPRLSAGMPARKKNRTKEKRLLERLERFKGKLSLGGSASAKPKTRSSLVSDQSKDTPSLGKDDDRKGNALESPECEQNTCKTGPSHAAPSSSSSSAGSWMSGQLVFKGRHFEDAQRFS